MDAPHKLRMRNFGWRWEASADAVIYVGLRIKRLLGLFADPPLRALKVTRIMAVKGIHPRINLPKEKGKGEKEGREREGELANSAECVRVGDR